MHDIVDKNHFDILLNFYLEGILDAKAQWKSLRVQPSGLIHLRMPLGVGHEAQIKYVCHALILKLASCLNYTTSLHE